MFYGLRNSSRKLSLLVGGRTRARELQAKKLFSHSQSMPMWNKRRDFGRQKEPTTSSRQENEDKHMCKALPGL